MSDPVFNLPDLTGDTTPTPQGGAVVEQSATVLGAINDAPASIVGLPELYVAPPVAAPGEVVIAVTGPWYVKNFDASIEGCPIVTSLGTSVPSQFADQVISIGATNGVTIIKR